MTDTTVRPERIRHRSRAAAAAVAAASLLATGLAIAPSAAAVDRPVPADNPDLGQACGIDVVLMLDWSESLYLLDVNGTRGREVVRQAAKDLAGALVNTNSRVSVVKFRAQAETNPTLANGLVTPESLARGGALLSGIGSQAGQDSATLLAMDGKTNWDAAIQAADAQFAASPRNVPKLTVLVTDGAPNTSGNGLSELTAADATDAAVTSMNALKGDGIHSLGVGVNVSGADPLAENFDSLARVTQFTSPKIYPDTAFDATTTDLVLTTSDFSSLGTDLKKIATDQCAGSLSVTRLGGDASAPTEYDNPVSGWNVPVSVNPTGEWILPVGASGASAAVATNAGGTSLFQWNSVGTKTVTVTDVARTNYATKSVLCSVNGGTPTARTLSGGAFTVNVGSTDAVACTINSAWTGNVTPNFFVSISRNPVKYGLTTTWRGTLNKPSGAAVKNVVVVLQSRNYSSSAWTSIKSFRTDSNGFYTYTFAPTRNKQYRVYYGGSAALKVNKGASAIKLIKVTYNVTASINDGTLKRGQTLRVSGAVKPNTGVRYVYLQRWTGTAWTNVKKVSLTSGGLYSTTTTSSTVGTRKYRVVHPGDSVRATGASATKTVVWS